MLTPIVNAVNVKEYDFKQSKYEVAPRLLASMSSENPLLSQSLVLDIYRNCFARIYIFSPSPLGPWMAPPLVVFARQDPRGGSSGSGLRLWAPLPRSTST